MKILVCTDGSEHSQKALEKAAIIAEGCNVDEVAIIHVYDEKKFNLMRKKAIICIISGRWLKFDQI